MLGFDLHVVFPLLFGGHRLVADDVAGQATAQLWLHHPIGFLEGLADHGPLLSEVEPHAEVLATGKCATKGSLVDMLLESRAVTPNNSLLPRLPWAYCTHALAVSRRMATHLIAQAFPASDVFDNLLVSHVAPQARRQQLKLWAFNQSLFAQVAKVTPARILPSALLSYERTVGEVGGAGESARTAIRARHRPRGTVYRPARPLG